MKPLEQPSADSNVLSGERSVLTQLEQTCEREGALDIAATMRALYELAGADIAKVRNALASECSEAEFTERAGSHLLRRQGKLLRPMCTALSARLSGALPDAAVHCATAAELVHSATLLHDDVVDQGVERRGAPSAWTIYGNAASVFAGDWLLVSALRRVRQARVDGLLDKLLDVLDAMIVGESLQLEARGQLHFDQARYFRVVRGKTAALFGWACYAGGRTGGMSEQQAAPLAQFGEAIGCAFQIQDDVLDLTGDAESLGKEPLIDLHEGKATLPVILAVERDPGVETLARRVAKGESELAVELLERITATGAISAASAVANQFVEEAIDALQTFEDVPALHALRLVAHATVARKV